MSQSNSSPRPSVTGQTLEAGPDNGGIINPTTPPMQSMGTRNDSAIGSPLLALTAQLAGAFDLRTCGI